MDATDRKMDKIEGDLLKTKQIKKNFTEWLDMSLDSFLMDPPASGFQRGYREALREVLRQWKEYNAETQ